MSRFSNLELGNESGDHSLESKPLVKNEAYYLAEARSAFENGNFESGLRLYARMLEFNPRNPDAWTGQVRMLIELGEYHEARLWADKALEMFPREAELLAAKAVALARGGAMQEALACSDAAVQERGNTPYIWLARADVLLAGEQPLADYCLDKALALAPADWFITWLAARIRSFYRQFALALKLLQKAVELNSGHFLLWLELGLCQRSLGLVGPARQSFDTARQLNPRCSEAKLQITKLSHAGLGAGLRGWWHKIFIR